MAYASDESMFEYLNVVSKMFDSEACCLIVRLKAINSTTNMLLKKVLV